MSAIRSDLVHELTNFVKLTQFHQVDKTNKYNNKSVPIRNFNAEEPATTFFGKLAFLTV